MMKITRKLARREKQAIAVALSFLCVVAIGYLLVFPLIENREQLKRIITVKSRIQHDMLRLQAEYETLRQQTEQVKGKIARRPAGFTLFGFLDSLAGEVDLKGNISYMKPSTAAPPDAAYAVSQVEMKLADVSIRRLNTYMYKIETSPNMVTIRRVSITREGPQKEGVTAILQMETLES